jgi:hypothetical protein
MIDRQDGTFVCEDPSFRIGPRVTRAEFLTAAWAQGAQHQVVNEPWHSWKLDGSYRSNSLSFVVILHFVGERLARLELCNTDARFGTSWADYSEEKERQRQDSHDAWLAACLGAQRSFAWGTVQSGAGDDPHGGGGASLTIAYAELPPVRPHAPQGGGDHSVAAGTLDRLFGWLGRKWRLRGYDTFSGESYKLPGRYRSEAQAQRAAHRRLRQVERNQPAETSGGQNGIQDQVFIIRPDATEYRYLPASARS